jgi:prepilin-type N-terminal cleavage/methylation domain-containing protein
VGIEHESWKGKFYLLDMGFQGNENCINVREEYLEGNMKTKATDKRTETNKRGITLIELVVVMVIITIGAVLLAPNIGAWIPNDRLRGAARDIVSTLRTAQMKAVSSNKQYQVAFNSGAGSYILQKNTGGIWVNEGVTQTLPSGIQISGITFPGNNATFDTDSSSSAGSMTLTNPKGATKTITLTSATGRTQIK